jgi:hypothetical protein
MVLLSPAISLEAPRRPNQEEIVMKSLVKMLVVTVEVVAFGWLAVAVARGQEFASTVLTATPTAVQSPYANDRPVRVSMTNKLGQVTTLEYRTPVKIVSQGSAQDDRVVAIDSRPARDTDLWPAYSPPGNYAAVDASLPEITSLRNVSTTPTERYAAPPVRQVNYQTASLQPSAPTARSVSYSAPSVVPVANTVMLNGSTNCGNCGAPTMVSYPPPTTYSVPNYQAPITGVPRTVYSPMVQQIPVTPVAQSNVQVGAGIWGQPVIYRPGQPLRNAWRWLTP